MLEIDEGVLHQSLVERSEVCRAETERIGVQEVMKVRVNELPIKAVIVGDEERPALCSLCGWLLQCDSLSSEQGKTQQMCASGPKMVTATILTSAVIFALANVILDAPVYG